MLEKLNKLLNQYDEESIVRIHMHNDFKDLPSVAVVKDDGLKYVYYIDGEWKNVQ